MVVGLEWGSGMVGVNVGATASVHLCPWHTSCRLGSHVLCVPCVPVLCVPKVQMWHRHGDSSDEVHCARDGIGLPAVRARILPSSPPKELSQCRYLAEYQLCTHMPYDENLWGQQVP